MHVKKKEGENMVRKQHELVRGDYVTYIDEYDNNCICAIGCLEAFSPYDPEKCIVRWFTLDRDGNYTYMFSEELINKLCQPNLIPEEDLAKLQDQLKKEEI